MSSSKTLIPYLERVWEITCYQCGETDTFGESVARAAERFHVEGWHIREDDSSPEVTCPNCKAQESGAPV